MKLSLISLAALSITACGASDGVAVTSPVEMSAPHSITTAAGTPLEVATLDATILQMMEATGTPGVAIAILNDGVVVHDAVYGVTTAGDETPVTPTTSFEAASLSKPLFGFLAMTFVEQGLLDLDTPLHQYLPLPAIAHDERYLLITARHVLAHQTGFPNWRSDTPDLGLHLQFTPGEGFFYSGEGYEYLADVLMHLAGTDDAGLDAIYQERIARPLGMVRSPFIADQSALDRRATPHRDGVPMAFDAADPTFGAAYSLHSDAGDYARFLMGMMDGAILAPETYDAFLAGQNSAIPADDPARALGFADWALGFSVYQMPFGTFYTHGGNNPGYTSMAAVSPDTGWGVVVFTNADQANEFVQVVLLQVAGLDGP